MASNITCSRHYTIIIVNIHFLLKYTNALSFSLSLSLSTHTHNFLFIKYKMLFPFHWFWNKMPIFNEVLCNCIFPIVIRQPIYKWKERLVNLIRNPQNGMFGIATFCNIQSNQLHTTIQLCTSIHPHIHICYLKNEIHRRVKQCNFHLSKTNEPTRPQPIISVCVYLLE